MTLRLLLIEDDPDIVEVVRLSLEVTGGFIVDAAATGREGLALAQAQVPDAVLMDYNLPDMPALEAIHALGVSPATTAVPVVLFTGEHAEATAHLHAQPNVAGAIAKPFRATTLGAEVTRLISRWAEPRA
jgi:CheY-like chemotaxis protein